MRVLLILCFIIIFLVAYVFLQVNFTKFTKLNLKSAKLQKGSSIKIIQITDFHNSQSNLIKNRIRKMLYKNAYDIVVLTGDIIDRETRDYQNTISFIRELMDINRRVKFFYVKGNHEWRNKYKLGFIEELEAIGVSILNNKNEVLNIDHNLINICGIDNYSTGNHDFEKAFQDMDIKNYTLLLSHCPDIVNEDDFIKADLVLCGHTHGGQIRLPFIGAIVAPGQGFFPKYNKGLYKFCKCKLYIDSGVGTSRIPLRFFNRSQITFLTIESDK
ncbi:metallophosphoesterase [Clostridium simiarum]|uniref:metallophosphoesterase n=1 Tax=Clostridium simiarum TaxID=2841506 RepID=UPI001C0F6D43|nr:metallophosphoesterase [Clostridium simiarum]